MSTSTKPQRTKVSSVWLTAELFYPLVICRFVRQCKDSLRWRERRRDVS